MRFEREVQDFGVAVKGMVVTLKFPFTNQSKHELRVEAVLLYPLMKDLTSTRTVPPGKKGKS